MDLDICIKELWQAPAMKYVDRSGFYISVSRPDLLVTTNCSWKKMSSVYVMAGSAPEVRAQVDDLLARYPPAGYGTTVKVLQAMDGDVVGACVEHYNSCD